MPKHPVPAVDIALPVLNEERVLAASVGRVLEYAADLGIEMTLTIADNGSTDGTERIARHLAASHPRVRYLRLDRPALGAAVQKAWETADTPLLGYMDADLATDSSAIWKKRSLSSRAASTTWSSPRASPRAPGWSTAVSCGR